MTAMQPLQPLQGLTVVTLEHAIAAPFATRQLADLGARVIKVERPGVGDFARGYDQRVRGLASHFVWTNRSKESLTLDVKHPDAAALLQRLIRLAFIDHRDFLIVRHGSHGTQCTRQPACTRRCVTTQPPEPAPTTIASNSPAVCMLRLLRTRY